MITTALNYLNVYVGAITAVSAIVAGLWAVIKFRQFLKDKRFDTYHTLIQELVDEQLHPDRKIKLDRQIAIVYELRNFPAYYPVSSRILRGLKETTWEGSDARVLEEIDLTLSYITGGWIKRKMLYFSGV